MERLEDLLTQEQFSAIELLRTTVGFDPAQDPIMWENLLSHMTAGKITPKVNLMTLIYWGHLLR